MSDPALASGPWLLGRVLAGLVVVIGLGSFALGQHAPAAYVPAAVPPAAVAAVEPGPRTTAAAEVTSSGYGAYVSQPGPTGAPDAGRAAARETGTDARPGTRTDSSSGAAPAEARAATRALVRRTQAQQRRWQQRVDRELAAFVETSSTAASTTTAASQPAAGARTAVAVPAAWTSPLRAAYRITATFGQAGSRWSRTHTGLDLAAPTGTAVHAVAGGRVASAGWNGAYGQKIELVHDDGTRTWYAHLSHVGVTVGQVVTAGQQVGAVGTTGNVTGPHLHLEVRTPDSTGTGDGTPIDPRAALAARGVSL